MRDVKGTVRLLEHDLLHNCSLPLKAQGKGIMGVSLDVGICRDAHQRQEAIWGRHHGVEGPTSARRRISSIWSAAGTLPTACTALTGACRRRLWSRIRNTLSIRC